MFQSARLKLTAWYIAIIMMVGILFSSVIYLQINTELSRLEHLHTLRIEREQLGFQDLPIPRRILNIDPEVVIETRRRITFILILVNLGVLILSGGAAYFLAGRTLNPIKLMVDEQNRFIGDSSHELRTPLTALKTSMEVTLRNNKLGIDQAKETLRNGLAEVNDLQKLTDNLLLLTQYQKVNGNMDFKDIPLSEIFDSVLKKIQPQATGKNIKIVISLDGYTVYGNQQSLTELFIIFMDNAIKYSPDKSTISVSAKRSDGFIPISIKDTGIGMDEKDIPHIFDRFYRTDVSRSKNAVPGFGLGLSIAKRIVQMHSGKIYVKSKLGKGTIFTIQLPTKYHKEK